MEIELFKDYWQFWSHSKLKIQELPSFLQYKDIKKHVEENLSPHLKKAH